MGKSIEQMRPNMHGDLFNARGGPKRLIYEIIIG